jgi:dienelactone hydrolase
MKPTAFNQKHKKMIIGRLTCITLIFFLLLISSQVGAERVKFNGTGTTSLGEPLVLSADLVKPAGDGPFPAVIMMHGCAGDNEYIDPWEKRLVAWGYAVLRIDSIVSRLRGTFCDDEHLKTAKWRSQDAYDGKTYLKQLKFIDKDNIALIGWSHGGSAAVYAIDDGIPFEHDGKTFKAAIAFYPYCTGPLSKQNAPLLILIGEKDEICKAEYCKSAFKSGKTPKEIKLKVYKNAHHTFDWDLNMIWNGNKLEYNPEAAEDAEIQVKSFLAKYLK